MNKWHKISHKEIPICAVFLNNITLEISLEENICLIYSGGSKLNTIIGTSIKECLDKIIKNKIRIS